MSKVNLETERLYAYGKIIEQIQTNILLLSKKLSSKIKALSYTEDVVQIYDERLQTQIFAMNKQAERCGNAAAYLNKMAESYEFAENVLNGKLIQKANYFHEFRFKTDAMLKSTTLATFVAKYMTKNTTHYFGKEEIEDKTKASIFKPSKPKKFGDIEKDAEDWLEKNDLRESDEIKEYFDENGNPVKDGDKHFYKRKMTLGEIKKEVSVKESIYEGNYKIGENGTIDATIGEAEAHSSISAGFYVLDKDGNKKFSPGINAEVGTSVTALEVQWDQQWAGNEMLGINSDVDVVVGKVEAKVDAVAQLIGEDGKFDVQLGVGAKAEAIAAEVEGSIGVNLLGGEASVKGGVNVGVGAHADIGYRDGILKCDVGASLGVGVSLDVEIDVGGMVNTVSDACSSAVDWFKGLF